MIILSEWTAGERLPPLVSAWPLLAGCLGLTGEGVARSLGTAGGGTTSTTWPASRGRGREEGRATLVELLELRGITGLNSVLTIRLRSVSASSPSLSLAGRLIREEVCQESLYGRECWLAAYFLDIQPCKYSCSTQIFLHEFFLQSSI